jgi:hypothetical protein
MGIVGDRPESGVRIALERPRAGGPPWRYAGTATTPAEEFELTGTIDGAGQVTVEVAAGAPPDLAERVRLMLRAALRQAKADGAGAPARKVVRWRPQPSVK